MLIVVAPEIDLRYERVYGYLQDDVTRRRPTVDLALDLVSRTAQEKLAHRALFGSGAPLTRSRRPSWPASRIPWHPPCSRTWCCARAGSGLADWPVRPGPEPGSVHHQDRSWRPACQGAPLAPGEWEPLTDLAAQAGGSGRCACTSAAAGPAGWPPHRPWPGSWGPRCLCPTSAGWPLAGLVVPNGPGFLPGLLHRPAAGGGPCLDRADDVAGVTEDRAALDRELAEHTGIVILVGDQAWRPSGGEPLGALEIRLSPPGFAARRAACLDAIAAYGGTVSRPTPTPWPRRSASGWTRSPSPRPSPRKRPGWLAGDAAAGAGGLERADYSRPPAARAGTSCRR